MNKSCDEMLVTMNDLDNKLLKTIKLPRNLKSLTAVLPAPKYKTCKEK